MNEPVRDDFFIAGGTLRANASSYIRRSADEELYNHIRAGEFCYVLTPRQMGKSSLMVSTALRLQKDGFAAAKIDLTKIGTTDISRWYLGILTQIEKELRLGTNPGKWWKDHEQLSPVQTFIYFLREALLTNTNKNIVIFIDEIDSTLKYDFRDDFFAGIRSIYNSRAEDLEYSRLTFVLLGVAAPTDLIKDRTRTPFNIGQEISLTNFSREEVSIFESGLEKIFPGKSTNILDRIYYWSNGHPYLTQKLCMAIADQQKNFGEEDIDNFVKQAFLSQEAYRETNLQFVRDMLVKNDKKRQLVSLYARIRKGGKVFEDKKSSLQNQLRLSGLIKSETGHLAVNNRIYHEAFNLQWIKENTEINWAPIISIITTIIALFSMGTSAYDSIIIPTQIARANDCFYNLYNPPEERLACLATMFRKDPLFGIGDNDEKAREIYFNLSGWNEQISIFQAEHRKSQDLFDVTRGLYYALADINQTGENTRLLVVMKESLAKVNKTPEINQLEQELDAWLIARNSLKDGNVDAALSSYNNAINLNSENPSTLFERGILILRMGDSVGALQSFDETIRVSKKSAPTELQTETPVATAELLTSTPSSDLGTATSAVVLPVQTQVFLTPPIIMTPSGFPSQEPTPILLPITSEFYTHTKRVIALRDIIKDNQELLITLDSSARDEYVNLKATPEIASLLTTNVLKLSVQPVNAAETFNQVGHIITYRYVVTNTGNSVLPGPATITDDKVTSVVCPALNTVGNLNNDLDFNESVICIGTYSITQADLNAGSVTNNATATVSGEVSALAASTVRMTENKILTIAMSVRPTTYSAVGQTIAYTYTINNTGPAPVGPTQFIVRDDHIPFPINCGAPTTTLATNQTVTCTAIYTITQNDMTVAELTNIATASGSGAGFINQVTATVTNTNVQGGAGTPANLTRGSTVKHKVVDGEWMLQIALCYGADFNALLAANPNVTDADLSFPFPKTPELTVPNIGSVGPIYGPPCVVFYSVQAGDTWESIAREYNADLTILRGANDGAILTNGARLKIPINSAGGSKAPVPSLAVENSTALPETLSILRPINNQDMNCSPTDLCVITVTIQWITESQTQGRNLSIWVRPLPDNPDQQYFVQGPPLYIGNGQWQSNEIFLGQIGDPSGSPFRIYVLVTNEVYNRGEAFASLPESLLQSFVELSR